MTLWTLGLPWVYRVCCLLGPGTALKALIVGLSESSAALRSMCGWSEPCASRAAHGPRWTDPSLSLIDGLNVRGLFLVKVCLVQGPLS